MDRAPTKLDSFFPAAMEMLPWVPAASKHPSDMTTRSSLALSPAAPPHRSRRRCCPPPLTLHIPLPKKPLMADAAALLTVYRFLANRVHPFCLHLCYFASLSLLGFLLLKAIPPRAPPASTAAPSPSDLDLFFTSVSAATVSSMGVVEMEFFSNTQLLVLTVLMLLGGEVFTSLLSLHLRNLDLGFVEGEVTGKDTAAAADGAVHRSSSADDHDIELVQPAADSADGRKQFDREGLRTRAVRWLGFVVLCYLLAANLVGTTLVLVYLAAAPTAAAVLRRKGIPPLTFAAFSVVSSFGNCGFIPTNENMAVFREHSGLLLLIAAVVLAGNTLYPPLLRGAMWAAGRWTGRAAEFEYAVGNPAEVGYEEHLLPARRCRWLAATVAGLVLLQAAAFCAMEGVQLGGWPKVVVALFMAVNSRHAGESVVDLATVSPAVLVLYVVMMYLPPYTTFMPVTNGRDHASAAGDGPKEEEEEKTKQGSVAMVENLVFSQLSYIAVFTILICVTESEKLSRDPLNFSVLNIVIEVVSAYGNVGFSTGYSCERRVKEADRGCTDAWTGFVGRWTVAGKLLLICVMFFGRLKKFGINKGGKAWKLA